MPYAPNSIRIQHTFEFLDEAEGGVFTLGGYREHNVGNQTDNVADSQILANKLAVKFRDRWADIRVDYPTALHWKELKVSFLNPDGTSNAIGVAALNDVNNADLTGGSGNPPLPLEVALCCTIFGYDPGVFATDRRRKRGRFYLPAMHPGVVSTGGKIVTSALVRHTGWLKAFLESYDGTSFSEAELPGADEFRGAVLSEVGGLASRWAATTIGNVFDVQRRRRRQQPEARPYVALNL